MTKEIDSNTKIVVQRMVELELARNTHEAKCWLHEEEIPAFRKTGEELIQENLIDVLLDELERIADGGYA